VRTTAAAYILVFSMIASGTAHAQTPPNPVVLDWRKVVTAADKLKLTRWREAFTAAIASARSAGEGEAIAREGALLQADAGLEKPAIGEGNYVCRMISFGRKDTYIKALSVQPASRCVVSNSNGRLGFVTMDGRQRARGTIFPGNDRRQIFLGTIALGDETRWMGYGRDAARDMVGALERIGERQWRIVLPEPEFDSLMNVIELTPAN
jgi:hypothetical protein